MRFLCRPMDISGGSTYGLASLERLVKRSSSAQSLIGKAVMVEEWLRAITTRRADFQEHMRLVPYGSLFDQDCPHEYPTSDLDLFLFLSFGTRMSDEACGEVCKETRMCVLLDALVVVYQLFVQCETCPACRFIAGEESWPANCSFSCCVSWWRHLRCF